MFQILFQPGCKSQAGFYESSPDFNIGKDKKIKAPVFELTDIEGNKISLKDFLGKVVFLDFWATWCPPCIVATPEIEKMAEDYREKGVEIISISLDMDESSVKRFAKQMNMTTQVALVKDSQADLQYQVTSLPTYFIIDQQGYIVSAWSGYTPSMVKTWRKVFDQLLKN